MINLEQIDFIKESIQQCELCKGLSKNGAIGVEYKEVGLNYLYPQKTPIRIFFIAESPPAPGKGFFYDRNSDNTRFKNKLFKLINAAGLGEVQTIEDFNSMGYYLADALNCRWDKSKSSSLSEEILRNCSIHLANQIRLFKPEFIVAMGRNAQKSLEFEDPVKAIGEMSIPVQKIIEMSFILVASNETDDQRISKLKTIGKSLSQ